MSKMASQITGISFFIQPFVQAQIKNPSKLRVTGLCKGNSPVTSKFPAQRASNAENIFIWWCHHAMDHKLSPAQVSSKVVIEDSGLSCLLVLSNTMCIYKPIAYYVSVRMISKYSEVPYNAVNFLQNIHKRHPIAHPSRQAMGVFCVFHLWLIFCLSSCNDVCNIMLYWTEL